jgi:gluconolactonase
MQGLMQGWTTLAEGLQFPEGPIACHDGSVILVEIAAGRLTRIDALGGTHVVAETGGGPNGLAMGPDGHIYVCNNGGCRWRTWNGMLTPAGKAGDYVSGSIQRVEIASGRVETLYTMAGDVPLMGPNDIVFDSHGGFWFTDNGKSDVRSKTITGVFYGRMDGSLCREVIFPLNEPNGIGLSPDGRTLYVAETPTCKLWAFDIVAPGEVVLQPGVRGMGGRFVYSSPGLASYDSLGVEACGNIAIATLGAGGITVVSPDGALVEFVPTDDAFTTNICWGGADMSTAYVTLGGTGRLVSRPWPRPGLRLNA